MLYINNKALPLIKDYEIICQKLFSHSILKQYNFDFNNIKSLQQLEQIKEQFLLLKEEEKEIEKQYHKQTLDNLVIDKLIIKNIIDSEIWTINESVINNKDLIKLAMDETQLNPIKMITIYNQANLSFVWTIGKSLQNQYNLKAILENDFKDTSIKIGGAHFMLQGKLNNSDYLWIKYNKSKIFIFTT